MKISETYEEARKGGNRGGNSKLQTPKFKFRRNSKLQGPGRPDGAGVFFPEIGAD
jgi:hypothetical protein